ncbi:MAG: alpha/beta hydrolase [Anaerolineae bacterium]
MRYEEGFFQGIRNARIYHQCWLPDGEVRAVLLMVHGLGEHSGRYMNIVNHLIPLGYAFYGLDHLGHGQSEGMRKHIEHFEDYTETLKTFVDSVQRCHLGKPIVLVGHSMGELIAAFYLLDHQVGLAGAVLSGIVAKEPANTSPATVALGKILSGIAPKLRFLDLEFPALCRDPSVVQAYIDDPLVCCEKATVRLAVELLRATQYVQANAAAIKLPILLLQGSADRIVDPAGARMLYDAVSSEDKTLKMYDGMFHEVYNEPERVMALHDLETWLEAHV